MTALSAYPVTIAVESATPGTYTTIAAVLDIEGPNLEVDMIDVTSRDSSGWKEFIAGLGDAGEVTFDVIYDADAATHGNTTPGLMYLVTNKTKKNWKITLADPTPTTWTISAFIKAFKPKMPMKDAQRASVTLKVTGSVTVA